MRSNDPGVKVLVIDDEPAILENVSAYLEDSGFGVFTADNGRRGVGLCREESPDIVLLDLRMPEMDGLDVLSVLTKDCPETPLIVISGVGVVQEAVKALQMGAWDYVTKPIQDMQVLEHAIHRALERVRLVRENKTYRQHLEEEVHARTEELNRSLSKLKNVTEGIILAMATTVEMRDPYTAGHQQRVSELAVKIAGKLGLSDRDIEGIRMAGAIHDIGKIYVPAEFLSKPGRLSDSELIIMKTHPRVGYEILKSIEFPWPIAGIVLQHHEKMDGSGYPLGLTGADILAEARILTVADVVEAMASHRPYRPALGIDKALEEVVSNRGVLYDSKAVDACIKVVSEDGIASLTAPPKR